jgi:tetratricopeptide (TPR) repeat protein
VHSTILHSRKPRPLLIVTLLLLGTALLRSSLLAANCPTEQGLQAGGTTLSPSDQKVFIAAMSAMNEGDFAKAETLLRALHVRYPEDFETNEALGLLYASQSNPSEAVHRLADAVRECPDSAVAHANLGTAYLKLQLAERAARELERAAQLQPGNPQTEEALGQAQMLLGQWQKATVAFSAALVQDPSNSDLLYNYALALFNLGQYGNAEPLLRRMPNVASSAPAQSLFGDVEEKLGDYKQAAQHYMNAAQLDPSEANVYLLGVEFLRHWTFDPAIQQFVAGVQKFPDSQRMRLGLAIAYYGNEKYDQAIQILADLLAAAPGNLLYAELLGRTCAVLAEGLNPRCESLLQFAERHPQNAVVATYAASSVLHKPSTPENLETAQRLLQSAVAADPNLPQAQFEMGVLLQAQSKWKESIMPLEAAVRLDSDYAAAHYRLSRAYSHEQRHEDAQKQIALYQICNKKQENDLDARMKGITTLVLKMP